MKHGDEIAPGVLLAPPSCLLRETVAQAFDERDAAHTRIAALEAALRPFAEAFRRERYGRGVSARDWKTAYDALATTALEQPEKCRPGCRCQWCTVDQIEREHGERDE
jgi:hypothetical protein